MNARSLTIDKITTAPLDGETIIARAEHDGGVSWVTNYGRVGRSYELFHATDRHADALLTDDIIDTIWAVYEGSSSRAAVAIIDAHRAEVKCAHIRRELGVKRAACSAFTVALAGMNPIVESLVANSECTSFAACGELVDAMQSIDTARRQVAHEISKLETELIAL